MIAQNIMTYTYSVVKETYVELFMAKTYYSIGAILYRNILERPTSIFILLMVVLQIVLLYLFSQKRHYLILKNSIM